MTLIALTILLSIIVLTANEYELRKRKEKRDRQRRACYHRTRDLERRLFPELHAQRTVERLTAEFSVPDALRGGIKPGMAIPVQGSPKDFLFPLPFVEPDGQQAWALDITGATEITMGAHGHIDGISG